MAEATQRPRWYSKRSASEHKNTNRNRGTQSALSLSDLDCPLSGATSPNKQGKHSDWPAIHDTTRQISPRRRTTRIVGRRNRSNKGLTLRRGDETGVAGLARVLDVLAEPTGLHATEGRARVVRRDETGSELPTIQGKGQPIGRKQRPPYRALRASTEAGRVGDEASVARQAAMGRDNQLS
jgi:hypothetical protein